MDRDEFRKYGYSFVDWIAEYMDEIEKYPVCSPLEPGQVRDRLPTQAPEMGEPMNRIFEDFRKLVLPGITHWQHPSWFAYFPANNSPPSMLAELLTAALGAQCMVWKTSPAGTELEEVVLEWLRKMLGLPEGMSGVIQDTASSATLVALLSARERATDFEANRKGLIEPLIVYTSEEAHSSVEKGAKIAGYGTDNIRRIPTGADYALIPERLRESVIRDMERGLQPACVVATLGTTSSAAMDPLEEIGKICREFDLWLHVDAAYAGTAAILPEKRWMLRGAEYMDSFVFNPHKWMLVNFDCSAYFVRDAASLVRTFEINPEYLKTGEDAKVKNFRDWGIQLGRRFRALKLWFVIRYYGMQGLREMVREHIRLAEMFRQWIEGHPLYELMAPVDLSLVCFRLKDGRDEDALELLNREFLERINSTGKIFLTHTTLGGKYVIRMAIGSRTTEERHVMKAWELMTSIAGEMLAEN